MARGPVAYTCPDIDDMLETVQKAYDSAQDLSELLGSRGALEYLRDANDKLRTWGSEQEDLADEYLQRAELAEEQVENLKIELAEVQAELAAAKESQ